ncbi:MAG: UDP-N-acetylmuramate--L-alanine ligase [Burkholderiaceae bacterium]
MKHKVRHIHFVGIGGVGMSGIAEVLLNLDYTISGSDLAANAATHRLSSLGATIFFDHSAQNIDGADCVVTSTAVVSNNPEVVAARSRQIPVVPRALMLAELMKLKQGVAIAGTHGKTTTTSLVAMVLAQGGLDPTFVIGGRLISAGANARLGAGDFIVVEADESDASFLNLSPMIAVITNIDADHMETYGHDFARLRQSFVDFTQRLPFYGMAMLCIDDPHVREIMPFISKPILTYGLSDEAQLQAVEVRPDGTGMRFTVMRDGEERGEVRLNAPGLHNVQNALAAIAVGHELSVPDAAIATALAHFNGVGRRFQAYGSIPLAKGGSFVLVDDYAHHPVELAATLQAARGAYPDKRILMAFQPHRYTRTRDLFEDFVSVLSQADALLLTEVYPAGEVPIVAADGRALARAIRVAGKLEPVFVEEISTLPVAILDAARDGDVVITLGAGSVGSTAAAVRELAHG